MFQVVDEGVGIPDSKKATIFDELQRSDSLKAVPGLQEKQGGLGMGLALCAKVMQHLGGRVEVMDNTFLGQCKGTIFELTLPDYAVTPQIGNPSLMSPDADQDTWLPRSALSALRVVIATEDPVFSALHGEPPAAPGRRGHKHLQPHRRRPLAEHGGVPRFPRPRRARGHRVVQQVERVEVLEERKGVHRGGVADEGPRREEKSLPEASAVPLALVAASCFLMPHPVHPSALADVLSNAINAKGGNGSRRQTRGSDGGEGTSAAGNAAGDIKIPDRGRQQGQPQGDGEDGEAVCREPVHRDCGERAHGRQLLEGRERARRALQPDPDGPQHARARRDRRDGSAAQEAGGRQAAHRGSHFQLYHREIHKHSSRGQGFDSVLTKPLTMSALRDVVAKATRRSESYSTT